MTRDQRKALTDAMRCGALMTVCILLCCLAGGDDRWFTCAGMGVLAFIWAWKMDGAINAFIGPDEGPAVTNSCGCIFCDLKVPLADMALPVEEPYHWTMHGFHRCTKA